MARQVNTTDAAIPFAPRAYSAQAATEKALKALLVAHGRPVPFDHDPNTLADLAESHHLPHRTR